jgi:hypothetical protein
MLLIYKSRYPAARYTILWHTVLLYVANAAVKDTADVDWKFFFTYCLDGYITLSLCFDTCEGIVQSLIAMAVTNGAINKSEALILNERMHEVKRRHADLQRQTGSFMIDLDLALTDRNAARVETLINRFEEITIFDQFTSGIV